MTSEHFCLLGCSATDQTIPSRIFLTKSQILAYSLNDCKQLIGLIGLLHKPPIGPNKK